MKINIFFLFLFVSISLFESCKSAETEVIIVPNDYIGYVLVIYDQADGVSEEYDKEDRVYRISESGILKTKFSSNAGWSSLPKFHYSDLGKNIPFFVDFNGLPESEISAFGGSAGFMNRNSEGKKGVKFSQFFIGNKSQIRKSIDKLEKLNLSELLD